MPRGFRNPGATDCMDNVLHEVGPCPAMGRARTSVINSNWSYWICWLGRLRRSLPLQFLPANAQAMAVNKLEGTRYFQGTRPLDDYLNEFQELISDAKYDSSPATVMIKFRQGLDRHIVTVIAGLSKDRPSEEDVEGWYELAADLEQNRLSDEAFYTSPCMVTPITATTTRGVINLPRPTPSVFVRPLPPSAIPVPTESKRKSDTCRRCGETGHWASECKLKYDI